MFIVKAHIGMPLPISINMDISTARVLYATLSLVTTSSDFPTANRTMATTLMDEISKACMYSDLYAKDE